MDTLADWPRMVAAMQDAEPWWEPGTRVGYHAYSFGFLAGEIVRRATGRPLARVLRDDLAAPIGHPDEIWFGVPEADRDRLAVLVDGPSEVDWSTLEVDPELPMFRAAPMAVFPTAALGNDPRMIGADIPAGGKVSARAIARMYAALLGEVDGVRLISADRLRDAVDARPPPARTRCTATSPRGAWATPSASRGTRASRTAFGMAGAGGSWAGVDAARGLALAVTKSVISHDFDTLTRVARAVLGEVDRPL